MTEIKRVLIVDDDETMRVLTAMQLKGLGFESDAFPDAEKALLAFEKNQYDFIFMDIQMPGMDGLQATRVIREREQALHRKPVAIIALTASRAKDPALEAGMDDFLFKPVLLGALKEIVASWSHEIHT